MSKYLSLLTQLDLFVLVLQVVLVESSRREYGSSNVKLSAYNTLTWTDLMLYILTSKEVFKLFRV